MSRLDNILDYKRSNPDCDPNLYELVEVSDEMADLLRRADPNYGIHNQPEKYLTDSDGNPTELANEIEKYKEVFNINIEAMLNNDLGITKESPLYKMMEKVKSNQNTYSNSRQYYAKLAGVALYIEQQKRAVRRGEQKKVVFDNSAEIDYLRRELSPIYSDMLHNGELKSDLYPEFEVYKDVFEVYMNSVPQAEQRYNLSAEDWNEFFKLEKEEREKNKFLSSLQSQVVEDGKLNDIPQNDGDSEINIKNMPINR